jgi:hypothetical protein
MGQPELNRVRDIALALPEVSERISHGAHCFFVRDKRPLCYFHNDHRGDGRISLWCPAYPDLRQDLIRNHPDGFFNPPASASGIFSDWIGIYLDTVSGNTVNWSQVAQILKDAFRKVATKKLIAELDNS